MPLDDGPADLVGDTGDFLAFLVAGDGVGGGLGENWEPLSSSSVESARKAEVGRFILAEIASAVSDRS